MQEIVCKIVKETGYSKEGTMVRVEDDYSFNDLLDWVNKVCPGNCIITIDKHTQEITVEYEDRIEMYNLKEIVKNSEI